MPLYNVELTKKLLIVVEAKDADDARHLARCWDGSASSPDQIGVFL